MTIIQNIARQFKNKALLNQIWLSDFTNINFLLENFMQVFVYSSSNAVLAKI